MSNAGSALGPPGADARYLAPAGAHAPGANWVYAPVKDRTNGGAGFTLAQLDQMRIQGPSGQGTDFRQWPNRDSYLASPASRHSGTDDLPPFMEPTRHKEVYVNDCIAQVRGVQRQVEDYKARLLEHVASLETAIRTHLWVTPDFAEPASRHLASTQEQVDLLLHRLDALGRGFAALPRASASPLEDPATAPGADAPRRTVLRRRPQ